MTIEDLNELVENINKQFNPGDDWYFEKSQSRSEPADWILKNEIIDGKFYFTTEFVLNNKCTDELRTFVKYVFSENHTETEKENNMFNGIKDLCEIFNKLYK